MESKMSNIDFKHMKDEELKEYWKSHWYDDFNPYLGVNVSSEEVENYKQCKDIMYERLLIDEVFINHQYKTVLCPEGIRTRLLRTLAKDLMANICNLDEGVSTVCVKFYKSDNSLYKLYCSVDDITNAEFHWLEDYLDQPVYWNDNGGLGIQGLTDNKMRLYFHKVFE